MKSFSIGTLATILFLALTGFTSINVQGKPGTKVSFIRNEAEKYIEVRMGNKLFTTYRWPDNICKPVLYPVNSPDGTAVTRGFPMEPRVGEQVDHPHQIGLWLTYGNVNGLDFWGNGSQGLGTKNDNGGMIVHREVKKITEGTEEGVLATVESWTDQAGRELLKEQTEYHFIASGRSWIIDRITTLTAGGTAVKMPDTKEGMFGIRVARQLELPATGELTLVGSEGKPQKVREGINQGITGNYRSSEGITGDAVWGTRAKWMDLYGNIGSSKISLVILDHPQNPNYPTYWHARGYGLFSANPLGVKDFTKGKEVLDFAISPGKSVTFRYRVVVHSGPDLNNAEIEALAGDFAKKYK